MSDELGRQLSPFDFKSLRFDRAKTVDEVLPALQTLLESLQGELKEVTIVDPLIVRYRNQDLELYRNSTFSLHTVRSFTDADKQYVFYTDLAFFIYQIKSWLAGLQDSKKFTDLSSGSHFSFANRLGEAVAGNSLNSFPPEELTEGYIVAHYLSELRQNIEILLNIVNILLGKVEQSAEDRSFVPLTRYTDTLERYQSELLVYWPDVIEPLLIALTKSPVGENGVSLATVPNTELRHQASDFAATLEVRLLLRLFILALRELIKHPEWLRSDKVKDIAQILKPDEIKQIQDNNQLLFEVESVTANLVGTNEVVAESDIQRARTLHIFLIESELVKRLLQQTELSTSSTVTAEPDAADGGADQTEETAVGTGKITQAQLENFIREATTTTANRLLFGQDTFPTEGLDEQLVTAITTYLQSNWINPALVEILEMVMNTPEGEEIPDFTLEDNGDITVGQTFWNWLNAYISQRLEQSIGRHQADILSAIHQLTLDAVPALEEEIPEDIVVDTEDESGAPNATPSTSSSAAVPSRLIIQQLQSWGSPSDVVTSSQRLVTAGRVYRQESVRLQQILLTQLFQLYGLPEGDISPAVRSSVADEIEYLLRSKSATELAQLSYPGYRLQLLRTLLVRVARNPIIVGSLQASINQHLSTEAAEKLTDKITSDYFDAWVEKELNNRFIISPSTSRELLQMVQLLERQGQHNTRTELQALLAILSQNPDTAALYVNDIEYELDRLIQQNGPGYQVSDSDLVRLLSRFGPLNLEPEAQEALRTQFNGYVRGRTNFLENRAVLNRDDQSLLAQIARTHFRLDTDPTKQQLEIDQIHRTIDSFILLKKSPNFLFLLDRGKFELIFRVQLNRAPDQDLIEQLIEYWKMRVVQLGFTITPDQDKNTIAGDWDGLSEEDAKRSKLSTQDFKRVYSHVTYFQDAIKKTERTRPLFVVEALALDEEALFLEEQQLFRQQYLNQLKRQLFLETLDHEEQKYAEVLRKSSVYGLNEHISPPSAQRLHTGSSKKFFNPFTKLTKPRKGLFGIGRKRDAKEVAAGLAAKAGYLGASALGDAVAPGLGTAMRTASNVVGTIFGRRAQQVFETVSVLGAVATVAIPIISAALLAIKAAIWLFNAGTKIVGAMQGLLSGGAPGKALQGTAELGKSLASIGGEKIGANNLASAKSIGGTTGPGGLADIASRLSSATTSLGPATSTFIGTGIVMGAATYSSFFLMNHAFLDPDQLEAQPYEQSKYVSVKKTADPSSITNEASDKTVRYQIVITPKNNPETQQPYAIRITQLTDEFNYLGATDDSVTPSLTSPISQTSPEVPQDFFSEPITLSYQVNMADARDILVQNMIDMTFEVHNVEDADKENIKSSASVRVGNPRMGCFEFADSRSEAVQDGQSRSAKPWSEAEKNTIQSRYLRRAGQNARFNQLLCTGEQIVFYRLTPQATVRGVAYGGIRISANELGFYDAAFDYETSLEYTLIHELGHIIDDRNPGLSDSFRATGYTAATAGSNNPCFTYPLTGNCVGRGRQREAFAEGIVLYTVHSFYQFRTAWQGLYNFPQLNPSEYAWYKANVYDGQEFLNESP